MAIRWKWIGLGLGLAACGAEPGATLDAPDGISGDENGDVADGTGEVGSARQAVGVLGPEFVWTQGNAAVSMGTASNRFCFLTKVTGDFAGGGEQVRIFQSTGVWWLGGSSQQSGVGARARCVPLQFLDRVSTYTGEFSWHQSQGASTQMVPDNGLNTCLLTRVQGHFEGGGEKVEITRSNGFWRLGGASQQAGVGAGARCVTAAPVFYGETDTACFSESCVPILGCVPWVCGSGSRTELTQTQAITCGLGKMSGKFEGGGEVAEVYMQDNKWWLRSFGRQDSDYRASAYCMF